MQTKWKYPIVADAKGFKRICLLIAPQGTTMDAPSEQNEAHAPATTLDLVQRPNETQLPDFFAFGGN
jgi:hypothetical protein